MATVIRSTMPSASELRKNMGCNGSHIIIKACDSLRIAELHASAYFFCCSETLHSVRAVRDELLHRTQWEALEDKEKEKYPYEQELWEWLEKMMGDLR